MSHDLAFGICENKCSVEVSKKSEKFELVQTIEIDRNNSIKLYKYKNLVSAVIILKGFSGTDIAFTYSTDIPICIEGARVYGSDNNYARIIKNTRQILLSGRGSFTCNLMFFVADESFKISCESNRKNVLLGESVILKAKTTGNSDEYLYKFVARNAVTGNENDLSEFSEAKIFEYKFKNANSFNVYCVAKRKDKAAQYKSEYVAITVYEALKSTIKVNDTVELLTVKNGDSCTIATTTNGGSGNYKYRYVDINTTNDLETVLSDYTDSDTLTFKATNGGKNEIIAYIKDSNDNVALSNVININVYGWEKKSSNWRYYETNGDMCTGWKTINGKSYYFDLTTGIMWTNRWVNGKYWVKDDGSMAKSEWVDGGKYWVDENGVWDKTKTQGSSDEETDDTGVIT